jgi:hypothetical protein
MKRLYAAMVLSLALAAQGCVESTMLMKVRPDGSGHLTLTTRLHLSGMRAIDQLFAADSMAPRRPPQIEEELPAPGDNQLAQAFGTPVTVVSTKLDRATDGGIRTTEIEFADVRRLQMIFPPIAGLPAQTSIRSTLLGQSALMTFTMRPHEDGDALLVLKMPDPHLLNDPSGPITKFDTDSPEERLFKQAIKNLSLELFVETEQPLLRTNAPRREGNRATILDLDLDKMINAMDEDRARRLMAPGSFQEMMWQLGDLPGAVVPADREVFLEYEPPQQTAAAPAAPPVVQAPPDTEIYLAPLTVVDGRLTVGTPENITNNPGYDNQPYFTPDGKSILFTSMRAPAPVRDAPGAPQTDIYRYEIASKSISRVTATPESEYSPTVMPDGTRISVIRVEADGTQRLASITAGGRMDVILPDVKPVGYHAWADDHTLALFILGGGGGAPATLQLADTITGRSRIIATDIGRSIQRVPGAGVNRHISFVQRERAAGAATLVVKELDPSTGVVTVLTPAVEGSKEADLAWMPDGTLLMVKDDVLYAWRRGQSGWAATAELERLGLHGVTRLAVSPSGDRLALVGSPPQTR